MAEAGAGSGAGLRIILKKTGPFPHVTVQSEMAEEKWDRAQHVFLAAVDVAEGERERFLDEACEGDSGLRAEVESLLLADRGSAEFLTSLVENEAMRLLGPPPKKPRQGT